MKVAGIKPVKPILMLRVWYRRTLNRRLWYREFGSEIVRTDDLDTDVFGTDVVFSVVFSVKATV